MSKGGAPKSLSMTPGAIAAREWRAKNPEKSRASVRRWDKAHPGYKAASARQWAKDNRERANARRRKEQAQGKRKQIDLRKILKHKYGITLEDFHEWAEKQGGLCAICRQPPNGHRLHVDHDHATSRVRGLLCLNCNAMLGHAKDRVETLRTAIAYLKGG